MLGGSRAGVDGVGDPLVGRTAARRVELDAEVLIRATGVVAAEKSKNKTRTIISRRIQAGRLHAATYYANFVKGFGSRRDKTRRADWSIGSHRWPRRGYFVYIYVRHPSRPLIGASAPNELGSATFAPFLFTSHVSNRPTNQPTN